MSSSEGAAILMASTRGSKPTKGTLYVSEEFGTPPAIAVVDVETGDILSRIFFDATTRSRSRSTVGVDAHDHELRDVSPAFH